MRTMFRRFTNRHKRTMSETSEVFTVNHEGEAVDGTLTVEVLYGENLLNTDWLKNSDPYCIVQAAGRSFPTAVRRREGSNPRWFQSIGPFDIYPTTQKVRFEIYDKDRLKKKDDMVGWTELNLVEVRELLRVEAALPVVTAKSKWQGTLHVVVTYSPASEGLVQAESLESAPSSTLLIESNSEDLQRGTSRGLRDSAPLPHFGRMTGNSLQGWNPDDVLMRDVRKLRRDLEQLVRTQVRREISVVRERQDSLLLNHDLADAERDELQHQLNRQLKRLLSMQKVAQYGIKELQGVETVIRENGLVDPEIVEPLQIFFLREILTNLDIMTYAPNKVLSVTAKTRDVVSQHKEQLDAADGICKLSVWYNILKCLSEQPRPVTTPQFMMGEHRRAWSEPAGNMLYSPASVPDVPNPWTPRTQLPQSTPRGVPTASQAAASAASQHLVIVESSERPQPAVESTTSPFFMAQAGDRLPFEVEFVTAQEDWNGQKSTQNESSSSSREASGGMSPFLAAQSDGKTPFDIMPIPEEDEDVASENSVKQLGPSGMPQGSWSIPTEPDTPTTLARGYPKDAPNPSDASTSSSPDQDEQVWISPFKSAQADGKSPFEVDYDVSTDTAEPTSTQPAYPTVQHAAADAFPFMGISRSAQLPVQRRSLEEGMPAPSPFRSTPIASGTPIAGTTHTAGISPIAGSTPVAGSTPIVGNTPIAGITPLVGIPPIAGSAPIASNLPFGLPASPEVTDDTVLSPFESTQTEGIEFEVAPIPQNHPVISTSTSCGPLAVTDTPILPPVLSAGDEVVIDADCLPWTLQAQEKEEVDDLLSPFKSAQLDGSTPFGAEAGAGHAAEEEDRLDNSGPLQESLDIDAYEAAGVSVQPGAQNVVEEGVVLERSEVQEDESVISPFKSAQLDGLLPWEVPPSEVAAQAAQPTQAEEESYISPFKSAQLDGPLPWEVSPSTVAAQAEEDSYISPFKSAQLDDKTPFEVHDNIGSQVEEVDDFTLMPSRDLADDAALLEATHQPEPATQPEEDDYISPFKSAQLDGNTPFEVLPVPDIPENSPTPHHYPPNPQHAGPSQGRETVPDVHTPADVQGEPELSPFKSAQADGKTPFEVVPAPEVEDWGAVPSQPPTTAEVGEQSAGAQASASDHDIIAWVTSTGVVAEEAAYISPFQSAQLDGKTPFEAGQEAAQISGQSAEPGESKGSFKSPFFVAQVEYESEHPEALLTQDPDYVYSPFKTAVQNGKLPFESGALVPEDVIQGKDQTARGTVEHVTTSTPRSASQPTGKSPFYVQDQSPHQENDQAAFSPFSAAQADGRVPFAAAPAPVQGKIVAPRGVPAGRSSSGPATTDAGLCVDPSRLMMLCKEATTGGRSFRGELSNLVNQLRRVLDCPEVDRDEDL